MFSGDGALKTLCWLLQPGVVERLSLEIILDIFVAGLKVQTKKGKVKGLPFEGISQDKSVGMWEKQNPAEETAVAYDPTQPPNYEPCLGTIRFTLTTGVTNLPSVCDRETHGRM